MYPKCMTLLFTALLSVSIAGLAWAQPPGGQQGGPPPAVVVVAPVSSGELLEEREFVGTAYFQETSLVAAEVSGRVLEVHFEQGDRIAEGGKLVTMDGVLKSKELQSRQAQREEVLANLSRVNRELDRMERLFEQGTVSEQEYEQIKFQGSALERRAESLAAEIDRIREELRMLKVLSPFAGVVLARRSNPGEWLSPGAPVAEVARIDVMDIMVNVPVGVALGLDPGQAVRGRAGEQELAGWVQTVVPRGEVRTRTFPVKVRLRNEYGLLEGMEVRLFLSTGQRHEGLLVPRDAVVPSPMGQVIFLVRDDQAMMVPVTVLGFAQDTVGIQAEDVQPGDQVVVKGQERLRDGQQVRIAQ
ncbi:efflux RND transporter periplasmic adaptor subunit [Desulfonatronum thioautotrophicum]|uniref:efflux RND transporter periplasmic adaptor subunit n=1 Tax=Desulfonatronum thioautotrophicum TaxID=617001 RepID=UPI000699AC27|nr:efflux RND transporter periplasmic adaptor subunit [Desulfonatronum thioautotrophicum]